MFILRTQIGGDDDHYSDDHERVSIFPTFVIYHFVDSMLLVLNVDEI